MVDKDHPLLLEENGNRVALQEMLFGGVGKEKSTADAINTATASIVGEEKKDDGIISTALMNDATSAKSSATATTKSTPTKTTRTIQQNQHY